jgi:Na+-transporting NADH:ubiquinone oxidoreductase subunit NqrC
MTPMKSTLSKNFAALCVFVGIGLVGISSMAIAADVAEAVVAPVSTQKPVHRGLAEALDKRVQLLAVELNLDEVQQAAVRRLLLQQREQTLKVWNDDTVPAAVRIKATQGVADRTAEQIRVLLTDAQRSRYSQPRNREAEQHFASEDLESWMRGVAPKGMPAPQQ